MGKSTDALNLGVCFARAGHRTLAVTSISKGICLPPSVGIDFNELSLAAHPLLMDDEVEIGFFLSEPRPRLKLLPDTIDIEADDLLEA